MGLREVLDTAPMAARLAPGIGGLLVAGAAVGLVEPGTSLALGASIMAAAAASVALARSRARRSDGANVDPGPDTWYKVYDVEIRGAGDGVDKLVEIVRERSSTSNVRYSLVTVLEGSYSRSLVILSSRDRHRLLIEGEVFKTLAASLVEGVRLRELGAGEEARVAEVLAGLKLRQESGIIAHPMSRRVEPPATGDIYLGELLDSPTPRGVYLGLDDVRGHIGVFGSTGSGKSTTLAVLAKRLSGAGMSVVIMDWTGEYQELLESMGARYRVYNPLRGEASVNPLLLAGRGEADIVIDILSRSLGLSQPQEYLLQKVLESSKPSSVEELLAFVEEYPEEAKWDKEVKRGLARRIGVMVRSSAGRAFKGSGLPEVRGGISLIRSDLIRNASLRSIYILVYLAYLYTVGPSREVLVVVDEAHNVFSRGWGGFPDQLIAESRKYGLYLALATQSPSEASNSVILNTNTKIVHALRSARDKQLIAATLGLDERVNRLDKLRPGEALVAAPSLDEPVFIRVDTGEPSSEVAG